MPEEKHREHVRLFKQYEFLVTRSVKYFLKKNPRFGRCEEDEMRAEGMLGLWVGILRADPQSQQIEHYLSKTVRYSVLHAIYKMRSIHRSRYDNTSQIELATDPQMLAILLDQCSAQNHHHALEHYTLLGNDAEGKALTQYDLDRFERFLSPLQRKVWRSFREEKTYQEIADLHGLKLSSAYNLMQQIFARYRSWCSHMDWNPKNHKRKKHAA